MAARCSSLELDTETHSQVTQRTPAQVMSTDRQAPHKISHPIPAHPPPSSPSEPPSLGWTMGGEAPGSEELPNSLLLIQPPFSIKALIPSATLKDTDCLCVPLIFLLGDSAGLLL